jgi:hypothetical protein
VVEPPVVELVETRGDLDRLDHRKRRNSITGNTGYDHRAK